MRRALVVDDEPLLRRQVAEIVAGYGFDEILEAENGVQAVEIVSQQGIHAGKRCNCQYATTHFFGGRMPDSTKTDCRNKQ
jgi:CheY-like chemotaxis protein